MKNKLQTFFLRLFVLGFTIIIGFFAVELFNIYKDISIEEKSPKNIIMASSNIISNMTKEKPISDYSFDIKSEYATVIQGNKKIWDKNGDEKMYPASMTKIMTTLIAIENINNLEEEVQLSEDIFMELEGLNTSMAGFSPYSMASYKDLLYGTLLPSGADAALSLAVNISGSEIEYVKLMNEKAKALDMNNTNFKNVTGLHNNEHYTTTNDLGKLIVYALNNPIFYDLYTNFNYTGINYSFTSTLLPSLEEFDYNGYIIGGKTGFTDEAGLCLSTLSEYNGERLIIVSGKADGNHYTQPFHTIDHTSILNEYFKN